MMGIDVIIDIFVLYSFYQLSQFIDSSKIFGFV